MLIIANAPRFVNRQSGEYVWTAGNARQSVFRLAGILFRCGKDGGFVVQEAHIDHSEVDRLVRKFLQAPEVIKEAKGQTIEMMAPKLKEAVDREIGGSGKVRSWQEKYVGSKRGYAAVRPKAQTWTEKTKRRGNIYAVGYVTNAINSGHLSPRTWKQIAGKHFYQRAQEQAGQVAQDAAEQIVQALIDHLEE